MAQFDIIIPQNIHLTGVEYTERILNVSKGFLITGNGSNIPIELAPGTDGYQLITDSSQPSGLKWAPIDEGHTQNTDIGTNSTIFGIDLDGFNIELTAESASKFGIKTTGGAGYADIQANNATFNTVIVSTLPTDGNHLTNKTYVDGLLAANDAMRYLGVIDCSTNPNYPEGNAGDTYKISVAGKIGGTSGEVVEVGDMIICTTDNSEPGDQLTVGSNWNILQTNIDGVVLGPTSSINNEVALFDGTSGKLIKGGGTLGTMAFESLGSYVAKSTFDAQTILISTLDANPTPLVVGESTVVGRKPGGNIVALTATDIRGIINVENGADVTDSINVDSAGAVMESDFNANTILVANTDNTPSPVSINETTIIGRSAGGSISALSPAQAMNILWVSAPTTKTSTGIAGQIAKDNNYLYVCTATNTWARTPLATNW